MMENVHNSYLFWLKSGWFWVVNAKLEQRPTNDDERRSPTIGLTILVQFNDVVGNDLDPRCFGNSII
jgi:hypothetical protein